MNCFCGMLDRWKFYLQSGLLLEILTITQFRHAARKFEPAQKLCLDFVDWSYAVVMTITLKKIEVDPQSWSWKPNWYHLVFMINFEEGLLLPNLFCVVAITTAQIQSTKPAMVPQLWLYRFVNNWNSVLQINILK